MGKNELDRRTDDHPVSLGGVIYWSTVGVPWTLFKYSWIAAAAVFRECAAEGRVALQGAAHPDAHPLAKLTFWATLLSSGPLLCLVWVKIHIFLTLLLVPVLGPLAFITWVSGLEEAACLLVAWVVFLVNNLYFRQFQDKR